jgi:hypothetical protein
MCHSQPAREQQPPVPIPGRHNCSALYHAVRKNRVRTLSAANSSAAVMTN